MNILLLGKDGQVGWALQRALAPLGEVTSMGRGQADLSQPNQLNAVLTAARADVVVNAAAYTAVDKAETEPGLATAVNADSVEVIAKHCADNGALLVHYSTDYVFDGSSKIPYRETDVTNPLSVYGATKQAGEAAIANAAGRHFVFRTSWVHGSHGANFARTMLRLAGDREELRVVDDQIGSPTSADLIADITAHAVRQAMRDVDTAWGTYHLAASGTTSWRSYAALVISEAIESGLHLKTKPDRVLPISTAEYPTPAKRPLNSHLDTGKLAKQFGLVLPDWQDGVRRTVQEIVRQVR